MELILELHKVVCRKIRLPRPDISRNTQSVMYCVLRRKDLSITKTSKIFRIYFGKSTYCKVMLYRMNVDSYRLENMFMTLDPKFKQIRALKEEYVLFNNSEYESADQIEQELERLIKKFKASDIAMFRNFAALLNGYRKKIIRFFTRAEVVRASKDEYFSRLSNGPMESFNRKPKDYKRNSRGSSNFDYTRNRIL